MLSVCVTGVAGLIGSHVAKELIRRGHQVVGIDDLSGGRRENVPQEGVNFQFRQLDLVKNFHGIRDVLNACYVNRVVHCAATAYEGLSVFSPAAITENIVVSTTNLVTACVQRGHVKTFVNTSSMARYGHILAPFNESDIPNPVDPYGAAKLFAERQATMIGELHGIKVVNTIPHSVNGPGQKYDDPYRNVASIMINLMLQKRQPFIYGDGEQKRGFCDVRDVVPIYVKLVEDENSFEHGEAINVGPDSNEDFVSINQLAQKIAERLNFELKPIYQTARPNEVRLANCTATKIKSRFGFQQRYSLDQTIDDMIEEIKRSGTRTFLYGKPGVEIFSSCKKKCPDTWAKQLF